MTNKNKSQAQQTCFLLVITFFVFLCVFGTIIYLSNMLFPKQIVLGTVFIPKQWAIIHSMTALALVNTLTFPIIHKYIKRVGKTLSSKEWVIVYFFINVITVWIIARLADQLGFGIKSWRVAVGLAIALSVARKSTILLIKKIKKI